jgi:hypothetical protein
MRNSVYDRHSPNVGDCHRFTKEVEDESGEEDESVC